MECHATLKDALEYVEATELIHYESAVGDLTNISNTMTDRVVTNKCIER